MTNNATFEELIADAQSAHFAGWDFSFLNGRWFEDQPSWNYRELVEKQLPDSRSLLDMGTGGGELLASLSGLPANTCATEAYAPNVSIARATLAPLGIQVFEFQDDDNLPFDDVAFDLIINRHESYAPDELRRILQPNGRFLTQQVGGGDNCGINERLGAPISTEYDHWNLAYAVDELQTAGFRIVDAREEMTRTVFRDIGAVVYYLNAIPWQIPGFSVDLYCDQLRQLHRQIVSDGEFVTYNSRFYIESVRPAERSSFREVNHPAVP